MGGEENGCLKRIKKAELQGELPSPDVMRFPRWGGLPLWWWARCGELQGVGDLS